MWMQVGERGRKVGFAGTVADGRQEGQGGDCKITYIRGGDRERCPWRGIATRDCWGSKKYKKNLKRMKRDGVGLLVLSLTRGSQGFGGYT